MSLARRIGTFLVILGLGLIGYFVFSDLARQASYGSLVIGTIALIGGIAVLVGNPAPEGHPNPRFRTLNKIMKKDDQIEGKKK